MKHLFFVALLGSTALATTAAVAQPSSAAGQVQMQDGFIVAQQQNQMVSSNLMDADVVGPDNESIGEVEDLLLDREGRVAGVIVEVGGFLGIGEKNVAIPSDTIDFVLVGDPDARTASAAQTGAVGTSGTAPDGTMGAPGTATGTVQAPDAAGTTATGTAGTGSMSGTGTSTMGDVGAADPVTGEMEQNTNWGWTGGQIDHVRVDFTREQLENAPEFTSVED